MRFYWLKSASNESNLKQRTLLPEHFCFYKLLFEADNHILSYPDIQYFLQWETGEFQRTPKLWHTFWCVYNHSMIYDVMLNSKLHAFFTDNKHSYLAISTCKFKQLLSHYVDSLLTFYLYLISCEKKVSICKNIMDWIFSCFNHNKCMSKFKVTFFARAGD